MNYRYAGKQKTLALGVYPAVSLAKARQKRDKARELLADGVDPSTAKREEKLAKAGAARNTFKAIALEWHTMKAKGSGAGTTSAKRLTQMENHIFPAIGSRPVADVEPAEILALLQAVAAKGTGDLRDTTRAEPLTKLCARFGLLTWTRPGELRQAKWEQFDMDAAEWRIPAIRMKTGKHLQAHTVPLSPPALALLPKLRELSSHTDRLFPSNGNASGVISENTINKLFRRMGYADRQSHHGLRASARSLLSERSWSMEALERQL